MARSRKTLWRAKRSPGRRQSKSERPDYDCHPGDPALSDWVKRHEGATTSRHCLPPFTSVQWRILSGRHLCTLYIYVRRPCPRGAAVASAGHSSAQSALQEAGQDLTPRHRQVPSDHPDRHFELTKRSVRASPISTGPTTMTLDSHKSMSILGPRTKTAWGPQTKRQPSHP